MVVVPTAPSPMLTASPWKKASCTLVLVLKKFWSPLTLQSWVHVSDFDFTSLLQLHWFLPLGIASGFCGAAVLLLLKEGERITRRLTVPLYIRMMWAGAVVGALALMVPGVLGNGHEAANEVLSRDDIHLNLLIGLFAAKFLATVVTVSSGTVGGVFTPTLLLGASLGSVFAECLAVIGTVPADYPEVKAGQPAAAG